MTLQMLSVGLGAMTTLLWPIFRLRAQDFTDPGFIPSLYSTSDIFDRAISLERLALREPLPVTGITVPHHLLAADLIARGFWAASGNTFDRVIVISPNHFRKDGHLFEITLRGFQTVFGTIENDLIGSKVLIESGPTFGLSEVFDKEHGIQALLPFVKWFFPNAKVIPVIVSSLSTREDWDAAVCAIRPLLGPRTLLVQSTDFSHYLRPEIASQRDQEILNIIAADDRDAVIGLVHPDHLDSKGCQYIQMSLQAGLKSNAVVIGNRNSAEYVHDATRTTSYVVEAYTSGEISRFPISYNDQQVFYFSGDGMFGRWMARYLADPTVSAGLAASVKHLTGGSPLIINLEGVLLEEPPEGLPVTVHCMHAPLTTPFLRALNVRAACLANNHSFDLGDVGLQESKRLLRAAGITPLLHGESADLGPLRVVPLNFIGGATQAGYPLMHEDEIEMLNTLDAKPPLVALVHWGREYTARTTATEHQIAASLRRTGVSAIIGTHSHRAAESIEVRQGGEYQFCYSLGNFIFDQRSSRASGALLEFRVFDQRTFATRLLPIPNYFELGQELLNVKTPS